MKNVREVYYNGSESDFCLREYSTGSRLVNVIKTDTPTFKNSPLNSVVDRDSFLEGLNFSLKAAQKDCNRNTLQFGMGLASGQSHTIPTTHYETQTFEGVALPQMLLGSNNYSVCRELLRATLWRENSKKRITHLCRPVIQRSQFSKRGVYRDLSLKGGSTEKRLLSSFILKDLSKCHLGAPEQAIPPQEFL